MDQGFMDWLNSILSMGDQYQLDENDIANLGQYMLYQQAYQGQQQYDLANQQNQFQQDQLGFQQEKLGYDTEELSFLRDQLGYKGQELEFALEQFRFKSGPEFEFYKELQGQQHEAAMQMSQDDVFQSANQLQQTRLNTDMASMNRDMARFRYGQEMGLAAPLNGTNHVVPKVLQIAGY